MSTTRWRVATGMVALLLAQVSVARAESGNSVQPDKCPYTFGSAMPAGTFCAYRGAGRDKSGQVCTPDLVVIWTSEANRAVYLATVSEPSLVLAANASDTEGPAQTAEVVGYTLEEQSPLEPMRGQIKLHSPKLGATASRDRLSVKLSSHDLPRGQSGQCAIASFDGAFLGVMSPPQAAARLDGRLL